MEQFAPKAEAYLPEPKFRYAPSRREIDFAQIVAAGGDMVEALKLASLVTEEEFQAADRAQLYRMGTKLLSTPAVQERIDYYLILHKASMSITVERIEQELASVAFSDFALLYHKEDGPVEWVEDIFAAPNPDGSRPQVQKPKWRAGDPVRNPHDLPRHIRAAVKEWGFDKDGVLKAKFHDKLKAAHLMADLEGYLNESNRTKATQINISIGDGKGEAPARRIEGRVIDTPAMPPEEDLGCLG